jgi:hypothetical protein
LIPSRVVLMDGSGPVHGVVAHAYKISTTGFFQLEFCLAIRTWVVLYPMFVFLFTLR